MLLFLLFLSILPLFANEQLFMLCDRYERHFSVLALHAGDGELPLSLAKKYPHAVVVMTEQDLGIDHKAATLLLEKCKKAPELTNVVLLSGRINWADLQEISKSDHFDIVLLGKSPFDLHHPKHVTPENLIELLLKLSPHLFIKKTFYQSQETSYMENGLLFRPDHPNLTYHCSFENCFTFGNYLRSEETHGITKCPGLSLIAFLTYRGLWPDHDTIKNQLKDPSIYENYARATPWNTIISGQLINFNIPPNTAPFHTDPLSPTLWEIFDSLFACKSKREMREFIENHYFD